MSMSMLIAISVSYGKLLFSQVDDWSALSTLSNIYDGTFWENS